MKTLIMLDSFKGTLSSLEANQIVKNTIHQYDPDKEILALPFSDGGEGMLDVFHVLYPKAREKSIQVTDPFLTNKKEAKYLIQEKTAIIESAQAIGIIYVGSRSNPNITSTYGLGELIKDALNEGCDEFIIGLGGSCTNDGGAGMLAGLGMKFLNQEKQAFIPVGSTLKNINEIKQEHFDSRLKNVKFTLLSDVDNPLLGKEGATYIFSKQKGATEQDLPVLEANMTHYKEKIIEAIKHDFSTAPGSGACGGLGFAFYSFFNFSFCSGGKEILSRYHIHDLLKNSELVITGEGKTDISSFHHKVVQIVIEACKEANVPCLLISGAIDPDIKPKLKDYGFKNALETNRDKTRTFDEIKLTAKKDLEDCIAKNIDSLYQK